MSGGFSKAEVIANIRKTRSLNELHELAYNSKGQIHAYAKKEAQAEIKRRMPTQRQILKALIRKEVAETGKAGRESIRFSIEHRIDLRKIMNEMEWKEYGR